MVIEEGLLKDREHWASIIEVWLVRQAKEQLDIV
jgi:hypothetical protein